MLKAELRKIYLARQKALSPTERKQKSEQIINRFFADFDLAQLKFLHCFLPIEKFKEIDTRAVFLKLWSESPHITTLVPRVDFQSGAIENLKFTPVTELALNTWQIHEPVHDERIESKKIDLVLAPLLCADTRGFRVGYGKGFYDGFLKNCREDCLKIGLSYFEPIAAISDPRDHDVKLDFCVTPEKIWGFV